MRRGQSGIGISPTQGHEFCLPGGRVPENSNGRFKSYFTEEKLLSINDNIMYAAVAAIDAWKDAGFEVPGEDAEPDWDTGR